MRFTILSRQDLICSMHSTIITCCEDGNVRTTPGAKGGASTSFIVGAPISRMRVAPELKSVIGVGGKEKGIEIWQLDTQQSIFKVGQPAAVRE